MKYPAVFSLTGNCNVTCATDHLSSLLLRKLFMTVNIQLLHSEMNKYALELWGGNEELVGLKVGLTWV